MKHLNICMDSTDMEVSTVEPVNFKDDLFLDTDDQSTSLLEVVKGLEDIFEDLTGGLMSVDKARTVKSISPGLESRMELGVFTIQPSISGLNLGLESVNQERQSLLQTIVTRVSEQVVRFLKWMRDKIAAARAWLRDKNSPVTEANTKMFVKLENIIKEPTAFATAVMKAASSEKTRDETSEKVHEAIGEFTVAVEGIVDKINQNAVLLYVYHNVEGVKAQFDGLTRYSNDIATLRDSMTAVITASKSARSNGFNATYETLRSTYTSMRDALPDETYIASRNIQLNQYASRKIKVRDVRGGEFMRNSAKMVRVDYALDSSEQIAKHIENFESTVSDTFKSILDGSDFDSFDEAQRSSCLILIRRIVGLSRDTIQFIVREYSTTSTLVSAINALNTYFAGSIVNYGKRLVNKALAGVTDPKDRQALKLFFERALDIKFPKE